MADDLLSEITTALRAGVTMERTAIVTYLDALAEEWHAAALTAITKKARVLAWRNFAAYSAAAHKIKSGLHHKAGIDGVKEG